jgi:hypothetical protein
MYIKKMQQNIEVPKNIKDKVKNKQLEILINCFSLEIPQKYYSNSW